MLYSSSVHQGALYCLIVPLVCIEAWQANCRLVVMASTASSMADELVNEIEGGKCCKISRSSMASKVPQSAVSERYRNVEVGGGDRGEGLLPRFKLKVIPLWSDVGTTLKSTCQLDILSAKEGDVAVKSTIELMSVPWRVV